MASDLFDGFGELLHVALTTDADRALNTIAAAGCIVGLNEEGARRYRRDREAR